MRRLNGPTRWVVAIIGVMVATASAAVYVGATAKQVGHNTANIEKLDACVRVLAVDVRGELKEVRAEQVNQGRTLARIAERLQVNGGP